MRNTAHTTRTHQIKCKGKYRLIEIRPSDGAQKFYAIDPSSVKTQDRIIWLTGHDRVPNARVGLEGEIHYAFSSSVGRHIFAQKETSEWLV